MSQRKDIPRRKPAAIAADAVVWADLSNQFQSLDTAKQILVEIYYVPGEDLYYRIRNAPSEYIQNQLERLAYKAGSALGPARAAPPDTHWFHKLHRYLREKRSTYLVRTLSTASPVPSRDKSHQPSRMISRLAFENRAHLRPAQTRKGGIVVIQPVCEASAMFCLHLEKKAPGQADRLRTAANQAGSSPAQNSEQSAASNILTPSKKRDEEVAKRRTIVKNNLGVAAHELCEIFDRQDVPLPAKWQAAGLRSWTQAYDKPEYRRRIDVLIAKDKNSA